MFQVKDRNPQARARGDLLGTLARIRELAGTLRPNKMRQALQTIQCLAEDATKELER